MTAIERDRCLHCGEAIALDARVCRFCGRSALVNLAVDTPVTDVRARLRIAGELSRMGQGLPGSVLLQQALARKDGLVAVGVRRALATRVYQALLEQGVQTSLQAPAEPRGVSVPWKGVGLSALCAAMIGLGILAWGRFDVDPQKLARSAAPAPTAVPTPAQAGLSTRDISARFMASTVSIRCPDSVGSGFFVGPESVLTNAHVVCPAGGRGPEVVLSDGRKLAAVLERAERGLDLALLRVPGAAGKPLEIGDAGTLAVGDKVVVIGSPVGLEFTVHEGSVSNLGRTLFGLAYVQLQAKINSGNSGGPVLDSAGRVVGVVSLKEKEADGIGLALPVNYAWNVSPPLVPAPPTAVSPAFEAMRAKAQEQAGQEHQQLASAQSMPLLLGASVDQYRRLVIKVGRISAAPPRFEEVTLRILRGMDEVCVIKGDVSEWKLVDRKMNFEPRFQTWLEFNMLDLRLFVGESPLRWDLCPREKMTPGVVAELQGANPEVSRVTLR